jgi:hypothetical protein
VCSRVCQRPPTQLRPDGGGRYEESERPPCSRRRPRCRLPATFFSGLSFMICVCMLVSPLAVGQPGLWYWRVVRTRLRCDGAPVGLWELYFVNGRLWAHKHAMYRSTMKDGGVPIFGSRPLHVLVGPPNSGKTNLMVERVCAHPRTLTDCNADLNDLA